MQSALKVDTSTDTNLVTAQALRDMTITKEALFAQQKANVLDSLMSSMVKIASESGGNTYSANLTAQFDQDLLKSILDTLTELGYNVGTQTKQDANVGSYTSLTVTW